MQHMQQAAAVSRHPPRRPFNLHPVFRFENMGAFATLKKIG
jgi:hypothetical protein